MQRKEDELNDEWSQLVLLMLSQQPAPSDNALAMEPSVPAKTEEPQDDADASQQLWEEQPVDTEAATRALRELFSDSQIFGASLQGLDYSPNSHTPLK